MNSPAELELIDISRCYFAAMEQGDIDAVMRFFAPDVVQEEFPNRLLPTGATRDLAALRSAAERGSKAVTKQHYELLSICATGNSVAVEAVWTGTLSAPLGTIPAGGQMRARFAIFIEFKDRKIVRQRNYDCFDPF